MTHTKGVVTLVVLAVLFVIGVVIGFQLLTAPIPQLNLNSETSSGPACKDTTIPAGGELSREQVTVDVYNAGAVSGLASQTQRRLGRFGYQRGVIGNADELDVNARNVTIVTTEPNGGMARLLQQQFRGNVRVVQDEPPQGESTSIAVVVGDGFRGLDRNARSSVKVSAEQEICIPIESNPTGSS